MTKQPRTIRIGQVDLPIIHVIYLTLIAPIAATVFTLLCVIL